MQPVASTVAPTRRGLIIHDGLAFLTLFAVSLALLGFTIFLFKSFEAHRDDLAHRWSDRGRLALEQGKPEQAVGALRTALVYDQDNRDYQLLLAQALAQSGRTEEAENYFLNLWETRPGDGFINLHLARIARARHQDREATDYYHAAVFGSWEGDGVVRRREVRLELVDYLIAQHQNAEARNELFTVAGNAPNNVDLNLQVGDKLAQAGYLPDAYSFYRKAIALEPHAHAPLARAGESAFNLGDYVQAEKLAGRALDTRPPSPSDHAALMNLAESARRIQQLSLRPDQPARQRVSHILEASTAAQTRLQTCISPSSPHLADLAAQWAALLPSRKLLADNPDTQDAWVSLIFQSELETAKTCSAPAGDDALLLRLATAAQKESANGN